MLVDKDAHQRETITKWPIWLALSASNLYSKQECLTLEHKMFINVIAPRNDIGCNDGRYKIPSWCAVINQWKSYDLAMYKWMSYDQLNS